MTLVEIRQALLELTLVRRAGVDDQILSSLAALTPNLPKRISQNELYQREKELEAKLAEWWLIWDRTNESYGIIPREEEN